MNVSASELSGYSKRVEAQQDAAASYVEASLRAYRALNPDATVEELREFAIQTLAQAERAYGDQAALVAAMRYDETARALGLDLEPAELANDVDEAAVDRDVRYFARHAVEGDFGRFVARVADRARDHAFRAANETMWRNANRRADGEAGMRYARVPTGSETCGFCLMLASLGFWYRTKEGAGDVGRGFNTYHDRCDCRVVVGGEGTTVEGYDPDWYRSVYRDAREAVEGTAHDDYTALGGRAGTGRTYDEFLRDRIAKEIETRDNGWAWDRRKPSITVADGARPKPKERALADRLNGHGFGVEFVKPANTEGNRTADSLLNGEPWEFKQPTGNVESKTIGKNTIDHQFEEAVGQSRNLVLDVSVIERYPEVKWDDLIKQCRNLLDGKWSDEFDQVLIAGSERLVRIEKA